MKSPLLLLLLLIAAIGSLFADNRPNILVMMVDDMGYSDLGCYGSEIQTPHLDALAAKGIRYTQMYNTSKCWTTRISLMTGLYHQRSDRDFTKTSLAGEVLRPAGYHTWWSGKHHASFNPFDRGFDHFSGFLGGAINFWNPGEAPRQGEPEPGWKAVYTWAFDKKLIKPYHPGKDFFATDRFTDWAIEWLDEAAGSDGIEKPFFLFIAYNAPHWPLHAHPEDIANYEGFYDVGYDAIRKARYQRQLEMGLYNATTSTLSVPESKRPEWDTLTSEEQRAESMRMAIHAAMVDNVDQNVGRLVSRLEDLGELDNTLILFLADNGASAESPNRKGAPPEPWGSVGTFESIGQRWANVANTPLRLWKVSSHEGGINTPMIAHWPVGISQESEGSFYRDPCHLIDLLPTWMELAGDNATLPGESSEPDLSPLDGISLIPSFSGDSLDREDPLFFAYGSGKAMRDGNWKLVVKGDGPWELHDLDLDRAETKDLASQNPERVAAMEKAWQNWYRECTGKTFSPKVEKERNAAKH